jgi:hypothetical protein
VVRDVIYQRDFIPVFNEAKKTGKEPDWNFVTSNITKKFNPVYADWVVLNGKTSWYKFLADSKKEVKYYNLFAAYKLKQIEVFRYDTLDNGSYDKINSIAWLDVFHHCTDTVVINKMSALMKKAVEKHPSILPYLDTYAVILYKGGNVSAALACEEKLLANAEKSGDKDQITAVAKTINKIKSGEHIWDQEDYE